jgi:hypothetical protein
MPEPRVSRVLAFNRLTTVLVAAGALLAGCASSPRQDPTEPAYQRYWQCAYGAAMPYAEDYSVSPRAAAMRAQAACNASYRAYRDARIRYVRSVVPSQDRTMATTLGTQAALARRKAVTQRLTELVADAR